MDIGFLFPARVPKTNAVIVKCVNCKAENSLSKCVTERSWSKDSEVIETVLTCPDCGHEKIFYFQSKELKMAQAEMNNKIKILSVHPTQEIFEKIKELKENYKILFDAEQKKCREILEGKNERAA